MTTPDETGCAAYLSAAGITADPGDVTSALATEIRNQSTRCRIPVADDGVTPDYPDDLVEAVYRRVAHNLALRGLPLGIAANITDGAVATSRVGGLDAEVGRLEAPYRRVVFG